MRVPFKTVCGGPDPAVREWIRDLESTIRMERSLRYHSNEVRIAIPKIAWERYDTVPDSAIIAYDVENHLMVANLPDPGGDGR